MKPGSVRPLSAACSPRSRGHGNNGREHHAAGVRHRGALKRAKTSEGEPIHHGIPKMHGRHP